MIFTQADGRTVVEVWDNGKRVEGDKNEEQEEEEDASSFVFEVEEENLPSPRRPRPRGKRPSVQEADKGQFFFSRPRQPKLTASDSMASNLRAESEQADRSRLLSVFRMVNAR